MNPSVYIIVEVRVDNGSMRNPNYSTHTDLKTFLATPLPELSERYIVPMLAGIRAELDRDPARDK